MLLQLFNAEIRLESDVVMARQQARAIAAALKFDSQDQTRIATAVSEIARNTFQYGGGGSVSFGIEEEPERMLVITLRDSGKGIRNVDEILGGKYVSPTGMGRGILGAKRLMDHFQIETGGGQGTTVVLGKRISRRFARVDPKELGKMLSAVESTSLGPYEELKQQNRELLNALQELRARQEELAELNRELDETNRGVVALYAELNEKADFLQRASELKSRFLSNMSHEFRTPLNSIMGLGQILLDGLDGALTTEQEKQVKFIRGSAQSLMELVNDLLDLAKVEAGKVTVRPATFDVQSLFAALRGMLRPLLSQNSSVSLVFNDPLDLPEMYSDEAKVSQILRNFISNALKFTDRGEVRVSAAMGHGGRVVFSVADTGIGIAPEDHERIFQEWAQVEGKSQRTVKGSGLGLPLSRKFAQLLGGDVYLRSEPGMGSTFFAAIPVAFNDETETVQAPERRQKFDSEKLPVLVVEDNSGEILLYERYLKDSRFQPVSAKNLKEAREALRSFRPVAIILDVLLQGEHSWELLQELKRKPATSRIPVVVATVVDNRQKALWLGADAFHATPVERQWLLQQLETAAKRMSGPQLLLIDDDEVSRYLVKTALYQTELRISEAKSGQEGLRKASEDDPDLVVLDLGMPDLSGFEVLSKLKSNPRTAGIPVIIHTSRVLDNREREMLSAAAAIISKESDSRETLLGNFSNAFHDAGFSIAVKPPKESRHE